MAGALYSGGDFRRALPIKLAEGEGHDLSWRSHFRRDFARLIHSAAFRRLQGKTQLFAGLESDFFRNRLTHSLEVAQIAKGIALKLNHERLLDYGVQLDTDLVELAALAHDLGHPPFGHTGEAALDELMREAGGFEGNAQTLRLLCRLEKKLDDPAVQLSSDGPVWYKEQEEAAVGLNLCSRSLAAVLKYDHEIPLQREAGARIEKGYYSSEATVVARVKRDVLGRRKTTQPFRPIECQIMDLADDIAYSTYDIEDAFKAGLLNPLDLLYPENRILEDVARRVARELDTGFDVSNARDVIDEIFFGAPSVAPGEDWARWYRDQLGLSYSIAKTYAFSGFHRTALTSSLVNAAIQAVDIEFDDRLPVLSRLTMEADRRHKVSVLKHLTYTMLINTSRFKLVAHRGKEVVRAIFEALSGPDGYDLLPEDFGRKFEQADDLQRPRVVCDFIAGMTDRYAVEFYARLTSDDFHTMFKPH